jgi:hypothetical protein
MAGQVDPLVPWSVPLSKLVATAGPVDGPVSPRPYTPGVQFVSTWRRRHRPCRWPLHAAAVDRQPRPRPRRPHSRSAVARHLRPRWRRPRLPCRQLTTAAEVDRQLRPPRLRPRGSRRWLPPAAVAVPPLRPWRRHRGRLVAAVDRLCPPRHRHRPSTPPTPRSIDSSPQLRSACPPPSRSSTARASRRHIGPGTPSRIARKGQVTCTARISRKRPR